MICPGCRRIRTSWCCINSKALRWKGRQTGCSRRENSRTLPPYKRLKMRRELRLKIVIKGSTSLRSMSFLTPCNHGERPSNKGDLENNHNQFSFLNLPHRRSWTRLSNPMSWNVISNKHASTTSIPISPTFSMFTRRMEWQPSREKRKNTEKSSRDWLNRRTLKDRKRKEKLKRGIGSSTLNYHQYYLSHLSQSNRHNLMFILESYQGMAKNQVSHVLNQRAWSSSKTTLSKSRQNNLTTILSSAMAYQWGTFWRLTRRKSSSWRVIVWGTPWMIGQGRHCWGTRPLTCLWGKSLRIIEVKLTRKTHHNSLTIALQVYMHLVLNRYWRVVTTLSVRQSGFSAPLKPQRISQPIARTLLILYRWWKTTSRRTRLVKMSAPSKPWWKSLRISKSWRRLADQCLPKLNPNYCH